MKKITTIILLCLLVTGFAQSQTKVTISLTNPKIVNNMFKFDVTATVPAGQTWRVGSSNIRIDFKTIPPNGLTVHPDNPADSANTCLSGNSNYAVMTTTNLAGTAISLNIARLGACCTLTTGTYVLGRIRFNRIDTTCCTTDTLRFMSVLFDSLTQLTYGATSTPGWARINPTPCILVGFNKTGKEVPVSFKLYDNYPNPFNPSTKIKYDIPKTTMVKITVFDLLGRQVEALVNERQEPGSYEIKWDASKYASGAYFYKLETSAYTNIKKMVLVK